MKKLLLLFAILVGSVAQGQSWGMSMAYSSENLLGMDFIYSKNEVDRFHFGFAIDVDGDTYPEKRSAGTSNFGRQRVGDGSEKLLFDLGYSRSFGNITIQPEVSFGSERFYSNHSDRRFTEGGYSSLLYSESLTGFGGNVGYLFEAKTPYGVGIEPFVGYNTAKGINFGTRFIF